MSDLRRREVITLLSGAAAAWPLAARAQQAGRRMPRIGVIDDAPNWDHFRQGLRDFGLSRGRTLPSNTDPRRTTSID
jgi:hypothetical protein